MTAKANGRQVAKPADNISTTGLQAAEAYAPLLAANALRTLDDLFTIQSAKRFDKVGLASWRERLAVELTGADGRRHRCYLKRFCNPPGAEQRRRRQAGHAERSTAGVERFWLNTLRAEGFPVAEVVAFGEEWEGRREVRSALLLAEVPGQSLEAWAADAQHRATPALIDAVARLVGRFHRLGFVHRDLYLSHLFLAGGADNPTLHLIDLQRVFRHPLRRRRWLARELAQLHYSTPPHVANPRDRLRFLRRYLDGRRLGDREVRTLMRGIERKAARIAAHDARRQGAAS